MWSINRPGDQMAHGAAASPSHCGPIPELARIWRILTTPELRHTPRVAAFFEFIVDEIDALRPVLTG